MFELKTRLWSNPGTTTVIQVRNDVPADSPMVFIHTNLGWLPISNAPRTYNEAEQFAAEAADGYGLRERCYHAAVDFCGYTPIVHNDGSIEPPLLTNDRQPPMLDTVNDMEPIYEMDCGYYTTAGGWFIASEVQDRIREHCDEEYREWLQEMMCGSHSYPHPSDVENVLPDPMDPWAVY